MATTMKAPLTLKEARKAPAPGTTPAPVPESRASVIGRTVSADKIEWLGRIGGEGGHDWGLYSGQEYAVEVRRTIGADANVRQDGEILVSMLVDEEMRTTEIHRGFPYPPGTYASLAAAEAEKQAKNRAVHAPKPVDLLARLAPLHPTPASILPLAPRTSDRAFLEPGIVRPGEVLPLPSIPAARSVLLQGRPAVRGAAAIVGAIEGWGVEVSLNAGRLLAKARGGGLTDEHLAVLTRAERLLVGHLSGHPLVCELEHDGPPPEAETIVAVGIASCAAHAAGDVR